MGVINVFLGGTGKFIAEVLKGNSAYYGVAMPPFIAFDFEAAAMHTGTFVLGTDLLTVDGNFGKRAQDDVAHRWASYDAGRGLRPDRNEIRPGPSQSPEVSVMQRIGWDMTNERQPVDGLWGFRASGLLAFSALMDPDARDQAMERQRQFVEAFRRHMDSNVTTGTGNQREVRVNLVASTAGGTGAGMFLPIALWLKRLGQEHTPPINVEISLVFFTWSTFRNESYDGVDAVALMSKARTGTYAIMRELELLGKLPEPTLHSDRYFPLHEGRGAAQKLPYRIGSELFSSVYWIGGRITDTDMRKADVYDEGVRLVQAISDDAVAAAISQAVNLYKERMVVAATSIDYRRLRIAQRLSGDLAERAILALIGSERDPPLANTVLGNLGTVLNRPLPSFLQRERSLALHRESNGNGTAEVESMDTLIHPLIPGNDRTDDEGKLITGEMEANVQWGDKPVLNAYTLQDDAWRTRYVIPLRDELEDLKRRHPISAKTVIEQEARSASAGFRRWLSEDVLGPALDPEGAEKSAASVYSVQNTLTGIRKDLENARAFFSAKEGVQGRVPANNHMRFRPQPDIEDAIREQYDMLLDPPGEINTGLSALKKFVLVVGSVAVGALIFMLIETWLLGLGRFLVSIAGGASFGVLLYMVFAKQRKPLDQLRRDEELELKRLYQYLFYRQAADLAFPTFANEFARACLDEVATAERLLIDLKTVYEELQQRAAVRVHEASAVPKHSISQIGENAGSNIERDEWAKRLVRALRTDVEYNGNLNGLALVIHPAYFANPDEVQRPTDYVGDYRATVTPMATAIATLKSNTTLGYVSGQKELEDVDEHLDKMGIAVLEGRLPRDLDEALLLHDANGDDARATEILADKLAALMHLDSTGADLSTQPDRRRPGLQVSDVQPKLRFLLVPDNNVMGRINQAKALIRRRIEQSGGNQGQQRIVDELDNYMRMQDPPAAFLVNKVGPSIVAISIWAPDDILKTGEAESARESYYGVGQQANDKGNFNQKNWNFHILPEAAAAADIELREGMVGAGTRIKPSIHPAVTSRLLGNDPASAGPTLLELYYLMKSRGSLVVEVDRAQPQDRERLSVLKLGELPPLEILARPLISNDPGNDVFGRGRDTVDEYDAFAQFMTFDGDMSIPPQGAVRFPQFVGGVELPVVEWNRYAKLKDLQDAVVELWYSATDEAVIKHDVDEMWAAAQKDAAEMPRALANQTASPIPEDWLRVVRVLINRGKRPVIQAAARR